MTRVTVVNDNPEFLELVGEILEDERYETTLIDGDSPDVLERIVSSRPDALMIDLRMGSEKLHGWDIAMKVRAMRELERVPILICSADVEGLKEVEGRLDGTREVGILVKPFSIDALSAAIDRLLSPAGR